MCKLKGYRIYWLDGSEETIYGTSLMDALHREGYSVGSMDEIGHWEELSADEDETEDTE